MIGLRASANRRDTRQAGVDVYTAQRILGHAKVSTTMEIYTELREKKEKQSIKKLNKYMGQLTRSDSKK